MELARLKLEGSVVTRVWWVAMSPCSMKHWPPVRCENGRVGGRVAGWISWLRGPRTVFVTCLRACRSPDDKRVSWRVVIVMLCCLM